MNLIFFKLIVFYSTFALFLNPEIVKYQSILQNQLFNIFVYFQYEKFYKFMQGVCSMTKKAFGI